MEASQGQPAVLIKNGIIEDIGYQAVSAEVPLIALPDLWLCPAPIDTHVHLHLAGDWRSNLWQTRQHGLAAVRDLGHKPTQTIPFRADEQDPLVVASGPGLSTEILGNSPFARQCNTPSEFAAAILEAEGINQIKIFGSGLLDFARPGQVLGDLAFSPEQFMAALTAARKRRLSIAVHANGFAAVKQALEAGVESIEHGFFCGEQLMLQMAQQGTFWAPTLAAVWMHWEDPDRRHPPALKESLARIIDMQQQAMLKAVSLGVSLVMGSDAGSYGLKHGEAFWLEMALWIETGLPASVVYEAATKSAAAALNLDGRLGAIQRGYLARIMAVRNDPRLDPLTMAQPVWRNY